MHSHVLRPGSKQLVDFATLSRTGSLVNLSEAVRLAIALLAAKTHPAARR